MQVEEYIFFRMILIIMTALETFIPSVFRLLVLVNFFELCKEQVHEEVVNVFNNNHARCLFIILHPCISKQVNCLLIVILSLFLFSLKVANKNNRYEKVQEDECNDNHIADEVNVSKDFITAAKDSISLLLLISLRSLTTPKY